MSLVRLITLSSQLDFNWESADVKHGSLSDIYLASQVFFILNRDNDCHEDQWKGITDLFNLGDVFSHDSPRDIL